MKIIGAGRILRMLTLLAFDELFMKTKNQEKRSKQDQKKGEKEIKKGAKGQRKQSES